MTKQFRCDDGHCQRSPEETVDQVQKFLHFPLNRPTKAPATMVDFLDGKLGFRLPHTGCWGA